MHTTKDEIEPMVFGEYEGRTTDLGDWRVSWETLPAGFPPDESPFKGLPGDRCQCVHLGVVLKGSFKVNYVDSREEVVGEGQAYRLDPGHFVQATEHTEVIEFSPRDEYERTRQQILKNTGAVTA